MKKVKTYCFAGAQKCPMLTNIVKTNNPLNVGNVISVGWGGIR